MKNYMIFSTLASSFLLLIFGVLWQEHDATVVFEKHTWLTTMANWQGLLALVVSHSFSISLVSWLYIKKDTVLADGLRIGVIMGLFVTLFFGFQLMMNVEHLPLNFLEIHVVNLLGLMLMFYVVSGSVQGMVFHVLMKRKNHKLDENNIYPCRMDKIKEPIINETLRPAT